MPLRRRAFAPVPMALSAALALAFAAQPRAQTTPVPMDDAAWSMPAARLGPDERVPIDGRLTHPVWRRAPVFERSIEVAPVRGSVPQHATRVRVLYDDSALYFGIEAQDPQPASIRAPLVRHDQVTRTQDFVVVYVDPIGSRKAAQFFRVGASGSTADGLHTADDDTEDFSPDFDFDAASVRTDTGYSVVMRIPYASLRYSAEHTAHWRVMVGRRIPREQVMLSLSVPLPREALSFIDHLQTLGDFDKPREHGFVQWRPTLTVRRTEERPYAQPGRSDTEAKVSLDVKWRPRPELVLDGTLNPDFSQVALDQPQLSRNNRYALFFAEKRPFFLESGDLLTSPTRALYTRSVTDPRWGLRGTWRGDRLTGSALLADDRGGGLVLLPGAYGTGFALQPANHALLSRVAFRQGPVSFGGVFSQRRYDDDGIDAGENTVAGLDGQWAAGGWRIKAQGLASRTTAQVDDSGRLRHGAPRDGRLLRLHVLRNSERAVSELQMEDTSAHFRNDAGFVTQAGVRYLEGSQNVQWHNLGPFNELHAFVNVDRTEDRDSGETVSQKWVPGVWFATWRNTEMSLEYVPAARVRVGPGRTLHRERYWHLWAQTTPAVWSPLASVTLDAGQLLDVSADRLRDGRRWIVDVQTRPLSRLELQPRLETLALRSEGRTRYRETAAQVLGIWHIAARQSLRLILQRTRFERDAEPERGLAAQKGGGNVQSLTYAWRRSAGTVLYVGATRGTDGLPHTPDRDSEVFVKLQVDVGEVIR